MSMNRNSRWMVFACVAVIFGISALPVWAAEKAEFTFALLNSPFLTGQPDKLPANRKFLAQSGVAFKAIAEAVNAEKPAFVAITGNLTWEGTVEDYAAAKTAMDALKFPTYVAAGPNDITKGGEVRFHETFQKDRWYSFDHAGVHFVMVSAVAKDKVSELTAWLEKDLSAAEKASQVIVLAGWSPDDKSPLWGLAAVQRVTAWIGGPLGGVSVRYCQKVPAISTPTVGYPDAFSYAKITVKEDGIRIALVPKGKRSLAHTTEFANPRAGKAAASDVPAYVAEYRRNLARKPIVSFVQLSDTQLDDGTNARYKGAVGYTKTAVAEINALDPMPAFVVVTGDLTNKSTDAEWQMYQTIVLKGLKAPIHNLPGNHDVDKPLDYKNPANRSVPNLEKYQRITGDKPNYTWDANGVCFIGLDTSAFNMYAPQIQWLREQLEKAKGRQVIVIGHHPIDSGLGSCLLDGREEVVKVLAEYKVPAYLSGHRHGWQGSLNGGFLNYVCNDCCWGGNDNGFVIYYLFPNEILVNYKPVGQDCLWQYSYPFGQASQKGR